MGFLDYYRQFDDIDEAALNLERRERRRQEKAAALARAPEIDLSGTEWPDLPHSEIVNAAIARARGFVHRYPDRHATSVRRLLADRHGLSPDQIALGNGAAELLQSAALALLVRGRRAGHAVAVVPALSADGGARRRDAGVRSRTATSDRRGHRPHQAMLVICNPNDPTGDYLAPTSCASCSAALPEHVHVLLDEALVHFQDAEDVDACLRLVEEFPRLLVVRTFSKIYGLSGPAGRLRGRAPTSHLLAAVAPVLGVNALTQAAVEYALRSGDAEIERRRARGRPRARGPDRAAPRARRRRHRQPGELPLDPRPRHERRPARERRSASRA